MPHPSTQQTLRALVRLLLAHTDERPVAYSTSDSADMLRRDAERVEALNQIAMTLTPNRSRPSPRVPRTICGDLLGQGLGKIRTARPDRGGHRAVVWLRAPRARPRGPVLEERAAGALLFLLPLAFNAFFFLARAKFRLPGRLAQPNRGHPGPLPGGRSEPEASLVRLRADGPCCSRRLP
jgi:hypothetical protein